MWHFISNLSTINLKVFNISNYQKKMEQRRRSWGGESEMFCDAMRESEGKSELSQFLLISRDFIPETKLMAGDGSLTLSDA